MQLTDLNRFHWIVIGLLGGLILSYMWTGTTDIDGIRSADQREFERDLLLKDDKTGLPFISHIVVHPPEESPTGKVNVVLYKKLAHDKKGNFGLWMDKRLIARIPYVPAIAGRVAEDPNLTVTSYLRELSQQQAAGFSYRYGWWFEPGKAMAVGSMTGVLLIGGIWPTLLGLMTGAGFGPKPSKVKRERIDWRSFIRRAPTGGRPAHPGSASHAVTNPSAMADVTRNYEENLAPTRTAGQDTVEAAPVAADGAVLKLDGGQLAPVQPQIVEAEEVEVKGEYYPVVIRHVKKPEEQP